jgi:NADPH-dependent curcumin reductase CurA
MANLQVSACIALRPSRIDQAVGAFIGLFEGKNIGKMVVRLA